MPLNDPLLDNPSGTPLMVFDFLVSKYQAAAQDRNRELVESHGEQPGSPPQIDIEAAIEPLQTFRNFCNDYLDKNRPVELFYPDANFGIKLSNGESFVLAPPVHNLRGSMQESSYAPVTGISYIRELEDMGGAHAITGDPKAVPKGFTDMTMPQAATDKTQSTGPKHYDK